MPPKVSINGGTDFVTGGELCILDTPTLVRAKPSHAVVGTPTPMTLIGTQLEFQAKARVKIVATDR